VEYKHIFFTIT